VNKAKKLIIGFLAASSIFLVSCGNSDQSPDPKAELSLEELESKYVQEIATRACVQLMGEYDEIQLAAAIKYFRIVEAIVGGPWVGITKEVIERGNSGEIYFSRCVG
jgi:hypothetical protein